MEKENLANRSGYLILMLALMFFLGLVLNSCVKDNLDFDKLAKTQWNPELAIPLVTAHLSMDDIIKQADTDILSVGADNFITLVYQDQLISVSAKDAIQIPVQSFNYAFQSDTTIPLVPNGTTLTLPADTNQVVFDMGPNNQVDSVFYNSGTFSIQFSSTFQQDLTINLVIPNARLNGVPFSQTINLTYTGSTPTTSNVTFNIDDYLIDLSNGGTTFNTMEVVYTVTITGTGNGVSNTDAITIDGSFSNLDFQAMYGYIDVSSLSSSPDTVDMALFDAASGFGQFTLVNPSVHIIMSSSIGVETNASFNILQGINTNAGTSLDLSTNPDIPSPLPIPAPNFSQIGQTLTDSFSLANQGIVDFVNLKPNNLIYGVDIATAGSAGQQSFILDTSKFIVDARVELPLHGTANLFDVRDTTDFSISESIDELESLEIRIRIDNGFPLDVYMQLYMLDSNNVLLDSILPPEHILLASALVDGNGEVTASTRKETDVVLEASKLDNFLNTSRIEVKGRASTANNAATNVKIYSDHEITVKLGAKAKFLTEISLSDDN